jgi:hypothetical protein
VSQSVRRGQGRGAAPDRGQERARGGRAPWAWRKKKEEKGEEERKKRKKKGKRKKRKRKENEKKKREMGKRKRKRKELGKVLEKFRGISREIRREGKKDFCELPAFIPGRR